MRKKERERERKKERKTKRKLKSKKKLFAKVYIKQKSGMKCKGESFVVKLLLLQYCNTTICNLIFEKQKLKSCYQNEKEVKK